MKYKVTVSMLLFQKEPYVVTIEIEAHDEEEAKRNALFEIGKKFWLVSKNFKVEKVVDGK